MATGEDIRATVFARRFVGYVPAEVRGLLVLLADELDAGRSARPLIRGRWQFGSIFEGYDRRAVDHLLNALSQTTGKWYEHAYASPSEPWHARYGELPIGVLRDRYQDTFAQHSDVKEYRRACDAEWQRFPGLSGTRLSLAGGCIYDGHGQPLLQRHGQTWTVPGTEQAYDFLSDRVTDAATCEPVLWISGMNHSFFAGTVIKTTDSRRFWFPVGGTRRGNAVMIAVDKAGTEVAWFRAVGCSLGHKAARGGNTEVVISASVPVSSEILCVVALAAPRLISFFATGN